MVYCGRRYFRSYSRPVLYCYFACTWILHEECGNVAELIHCELVSDWAEKNEVLIWKSLCRNDYQITYIPAAEGNYQLHIGVDGHHVEGSPFKIAVFKHDPQRCAHEPALECDPSEVEFTTPAYASSTRAYSGWAHSPTTPDSDQSSTTEYSGQSPTTAYSGQRKSHSTM